MNTQQSREELQAAIEYYVRFHLKPGDLDAIPELKQYLNKDAANSYQEATPSSI